MKILIQNGRVIDPASGFDQTADLAIAAGRIVAMGQAPADFTPNRAIDAQGCIVAPGLVDLAARYSREELFQRIADARRVNPETIMPPYLSTAGLHNVARAQVGKTVLTEQGLADIVAGTVQDVVREGRQTYTERRAAGGNPVADYGYMMNNAEDYRALRDFAAILALRGESTLSNYYNNIASTIAQSMVIYLWDSGRSGFKTSDQDAHADSTSFYPGTTCQIFPQAFGVSELSTYFTAAYQFLNRYSPQWPSEIYDPYPWAILGYVAAKRGDTNRARTQMAATEKKYANQRALVTINELGFYQRTQSILNGFGDI